MKHDPIENMKYWMQGFYISSLNYIFTIPVRSPKTAEHLHDWVGVVISWSKSPK